MPLQRPRLPSQLTFAQHPNRQLQRAPDRYGAWDYMFISVTDVEEETGQAWEQGSRPTNSARRQLMTRQGCLSCEGNWGFQSILDGTSSTVLCIEDAGRAHPSAGLFGSLSTRPAVITADTVAWSGGTTGGRRMYAGPTLIPLPTDFQVQAMPSAPVCFESTTTRSRSVVLPIAVVTKQLRS